MDQLWSSLDKSNLAMLFAYLIVEKNSKRPIYAGQGSLHRVMQHCKPSFQKIYSCATEVGFVILAATREEAIIFEKELITRYDPPFNIARWASGGGLQNTLGQIPWNKGTKGDPRSRGGRPRGIPLTDEQKKNLSLIMMGKASKWMKGKTPWNKGLSKDMHPGLMSISQNMMGNFKGHRR